MSEDTLTRWINFTVVECTAIVVVGVVVVLASALVTTAVYASVRTCVHVST